MNFLKAAVGEIRKHRGLEALTAKEFLQLVKEKSQLVELDGQLANRAVNEGFSGGEKKRNEIFQMAMLEPKLGVLGRQKRGPIWYRHMPGLTFQVRHALIRLTKNW